MEEKAIFSYSFLYRRGLHFETMFHVEKRIFRMSNGHEKKDLSTSWTWKEGWKVLNTLEETFFASFAPSIRLFYALILISYPLFEKKIASG